MIQALGFRVSSAREGHSGGDRATHNTVPETHGDPDEPRFVRPWASFFQFLVLHLLSGLPVFGFGSLACWRAGPEARSRPISPGIEVLKRIEDVGVINVAKIGKEKSEWQPHRSSRGVIGEPGLGESGT